MTSMYAGVRTCLLAGVGEMSGARKADLKCYAEIHAQTWARKSTCQL